MVVNYYNRALDLIDDLYNHPALESFSEYIILRHLLLLLGEDKFNHLIETYTDFESFHKSFRQTDVFDNVHLDIIMWNFVHISTTLQRVYHFIQDKNFDGSLLDERFGYFEWQL